MASNGVPRTMPPGRFPRGLGSEALEADFDSLTTRLDKLEKVGTATTRTLPDLAVVDLTPTTVQNVDEIEFHGATVADGGSGKAVVTITLSPKKHTAFLHFFEGGGGAGVFSVQREADLSGFTEARLHAQVNSTLGSTMRLQYSSDSGATWQGLNDASGPEIDSTSTGMKKSAWISLSAGAKADVWLRVWNVADSQDPNTDLIQRIFAELRGFGV